jgi:hypothetical protein
MIKTSAFHKLLKKDARIDSDKALKFFSAYLVPVAIGIVFLWR